MRANKHQQNRQIAMSTAKAELLRCLADQDLSNLEAVHVLASAQFTLTAIIVASEHKAANQP